MSQIADVNAVIGGYLRDLALAQLRGYQYVAVTDHSYGLTIAGGTSMADAAEQRRAIDDVNPTTAIDSSCCRASKRTSAPPVSWICPTRRRRCSTWSWLRRIRGCAGTRIRPTACWPPSRTRRCGFWPILAARSPERAPT